MGATTLDGLTDVATDYAHHNMLLNNSNTNLVSGASNNIFIGDGAGATTTNSTSSTTYNTVIGAMAAWGGSSLTSGTQNTLVGAGAGLSLTDGSYNTLIGMGAGTSGPSGNHNVIVGYDATTSGYPAPENRISIGYNTYGTHDNTWIIGQLGTKQVIAEGTNAAMGSFALNVSGTTVIANTLVTANSRIFLCSQADGGTPSATPLRISSRIPGTSFTVSSTASDTSLVAFEIKEPA
jgi:hypothetical protein